MLLGGSAAVASKIHDLRALGVDDQLELARLYDRQIRRLGAPENAAGIDADLLPSTRNPTAQQSPALAKCAILLVGIKGGILVMAVARAAAGPLTAPS